MHPGRRAQRGPGGNRTSGRGLQLPPLSPAERHGPVVLPPLREVVYSSVDEVGFDAVSADLELPGAGAVAHNDRAVHVEVDRIGGLRLDTERSGRQYGG